MTLRVRRTNEQRSASTKGRLLEATIECLVDLGYARTTTTEIADRAGVSRGAQLHHYPTKAALVAAAVEHLSARLDGEFRQAIVKAPRGIDRNAAAVDILWSLVSGRTFAAWLELAVAARTDPELAEATVGLGERTGALIERTFHDFFGAPKDRGPLYDLAPKFAIALMQGLALQQQVVKDETRVRQILDALKLLSTLVVPGGTP
jgi:AcrR family transcriptional regulator